MDNDEMMQVVRALRKQGWSPKEIARKLGVRPAAIAPLVRLLATEQAATADQTLPAECWVTPGWSAGLGVNGHPEWPRGNAAHGESSGLVGVVVARELRNRQVSACGYLVDVWCMGVKNALGPKAGDRLALRRILDMFRSSFGSSLIEAPPALAPQIVLGAVDYARGLGIEPHPDFVPARGHLGPWDAKGAISFGREGKPYFVRGPADDPSGCSTRSTPPSGTATITTSYRSTHRSLPERGNTPLRVSIDRSGLSSGPACRPGCSGSPPRAGPASCARPGTGRRGVWSVDPLMAGKGS